ncbi:hypothetical protein PX554_05295 [Sphingomonas sp. H39-1-10]|uniref:hypothetical protein n=1 Tax=Sphingomonas TaxID=13687 RepID=UPI0008908800|nr:MULTISPECIES: hypothetical protein [Sphingomonas]MDF0487535.1 hypothetical protein [Sphingomonas pollutisoli]SDA16491.1 hypothetical protein SAMN03159340_00920 [Sphingomonas sp. NFR15]
MTESATTQFDAPVPELLWTACERVWEVPMIVTTGWWNAAVNAAWPPRCHHTISHDCHEQLAVPEPIEDDPEPALFA